MLGFGFSSSYQHVVHLHRGHLSNRYIKRGHHHSQDEKRIGLYLPNSHFDCILLQLRELLQNAEKAMARQE